MKKRIFSVILSVILLLSFSVSVCAANGLTANGIRQISKYGNLKLKVTTEQVLAKFDYGDILTVSFGEVSLDLPLCKNYSDVDTKSLGLFVRIDGGEDEVILAINNGNFAETYGIAKKTSNPDKTYYWTYQGNFTENSVFTLSLHEKAGYLDEFTLRNISYTDIREDYPQLTDAQFANFRAVTCGDIAPKTLYRSASPVDPMHNRNSYADALSKDAGVTQFINIAENEQTLTSYPGYADTYYATVGHIAVMTDLDIKSENTKAGLRDAFRYMAENPGVYLVHCREGKDRSGFFIAVLECLMGATYEEICEDYMVTYTNYYGLTDADEAYAVICDGCFVKMMNEAFDADIASADLKQEATEFLLSTGLNENEIEALRINLGAQESEEPTPSSHTTSFFSRILSLFINIIVKMFFCVCE